MAVNLSPYLELEAAGKTFDLDDYETVNTASLIVGVTSATTVLAVNTITKSNPVNGEFFFIYYDPNDLTFNKPDLLNIFGYLLNTAELTIPQFIFAQYLHDSWETYLLTPQNVDEVISTEMLRDNAVTSAKIIKDAVGTDELSTNSVTTLKITDGNVTKAKIATGAVTVNKLSNAAVETNKIATDAVTEAKIRADAVTTAKILNDAITTAKITNDAVTRAKMSNSANRQIMSIVIPINAATQYFPMQDLQDAGIIEAIHFGVAELIEATDDLTLTVKIEGAGTKTVATNVISGGTVAANTNTSMTIATSPTNEFVVTDRIVVETSKTTPGGMIIVSFDIVFD